MHGPPARRLRNLPGWAVLIGAIGIPAGVVLTKLGIRLKYRLRRRSGFGSETSYSMAETGITITGTGQGSFAWSVYSRAVRFPDGVLLVRKGAVRWLPDGALKSGTVEEAMALVSSKLPYYQSVGRRVRRHRQRRAMTPPFAIRRAERKERLHEQIRDTEGRPPPFWQRATGWT